MGSRARAGPTSDGGVHPAPSPLDVAALPPTGVCDLTTTGRRSGRPRTLEIWYVVHEGRLHVVGTPGPRHWLANLAADPNARLRLHGPDLDLQVVASIVRHPTERARLTDTAWRVRPWYAAQGSTRADWVDGAPMVSLDAQSGAEVS